MSGSLRRLGLVVLASALAVALAGCAGKGASEREPRGIVLISLSGLRVDAAGPMLDALTQRALVYDRAFTASPDTLASHVSLLSGLYPQEHRVVPPRGTLSPEVEVLPEFLANRGFRTAGFTAGGYLGSDFGFDRGFDVFESVDLGSGSSIERATKFLDRLGQEKFFVFVHSDAIENALMNDVGGAESKANALELDRLVAGDAELTADLRERVASRYRRGVAQLDRELGSFYKRLEALGLRENTVVAITADHGFELGEHGLVGHRQVYPETLAVPLLILGPGIAPARVDAPVQTVDVAASLVALAGLPLPGTSGRVLPGLPEAPPPGFWAAAEARGRYTQRSLLLEMGGVLYQYVESRLQGERDGAWVTREVTFDTTAKTLEFAIVSFLESRRIEVEVDGEPWSQFESATRWATKSLELPAGAETRRVTLRSSSCASPTLVGVSSDRRCLSFKLRGLELKKSELFDLDSDPRAVTDLWRDRSETAAHLKAALETRRWRTAPVPVPTQARRTTLDAITTRGEFPEPPNW